ncbi:hypothetical protein DM01DRAFT_322339 [Hesseltinella vesiculosa]|uniref:Uncharacterized protein n=1 Tax=Hesseltinella vesiculosa TaxID=101127 RepID=A0A1X2GY59_9FUNG|nr:hypothetical protein DM01DRAFT_322339 [Hesseltinella vesiculosa]
MAVIYMFSLIQDIPYPHPAKRHVSSSPSSYQHAPPNATILSVLDGYVYHTAVWYQVPRWSSVRLGSSGQVGFLRQQRQPLPHMLSNSTVDLPWEPVHEHILDGAISQYSVLGQDGLAFAVLYHTLHDDRLQHCVRVYYLPKQPLDATGLAYKDLRLPGSTWISRFSLEKQGIMYSRDPDQYRFRWVTFPDRFRDGPHSMQADAIILRTTHHHQPYGIVDHRSALTKIHSSLPDTIRAATLDIYRTRSVFYISSMISDNATRRSDGSGQWGVRYKVAEEPGVLVDDAMEYMAFVDGVHFQHERVQLETPDIYTARSGDGKVVVMSTIRNVFYSFVYTNRTDLMAKDPEARDLMYRTKDGLALPEFNMYVDGQAGSDEYDGRLHGLALDSSGEYLAAWTSLDSVFLYHRAILDSSAQHPDELLTDWRRSMVIPSHDGGMHQIQMVQFLESDGQKYVLVGLKNGMVHSYALDETDIPPPANLWTFIQHEWYLWLPMSIVVFFFVLNELQHSSRPIA